MNDRAVDDSTGQASGSSIDPQAAGEKGSEGSIKETVESIIVAFILAFIFRGFIVEAFVIPTGSMAPTLLGAHMRFNCLDCGYQFEVNYPGEGGDGDDIRIPGFAVMEEVNNRGERTGRVFNRVFAAYCPNCGFKIPRTDAGDRNNDATAPPVRYGDRILVLKYLYLISQPERWDVVVFKNPSDPSKYDQNYIKRLVGKPGESLFILDGDVYIGTRNAGIDDYVVQTKPRHVQEALWRIVSDNDYQPRGLPRESKPFSQPWTSRAAETGWDVSGREFRFQNANGSATVDFDPNANRDQHALTDWLAYDVIRDRGGPDMYHLSSDHYGIPNNVSDIKLEFYYRRERGDGPLTIVLTKFNDVFTATVEGDSASLSRLDRASGRTTTIGENVRLGPARQRARHVEFTNVDYRVTLRIDGRDVISTTPEQYRPNSRMLLDAAEANRQLDRPEISISAANQTCTLSHVRLWRDVYYTNRDDRQRTIHWGVPHRFPNHVMHLGANEYFVLGDNSPISGDARTWTREIDLPDEELHHQAGVVPARFMIGKAFFVYWPAGYRPFDSSPALVPNFGDMRFIH